MKKDVHSLTTRLRQQLPVFLTTYQLQSLSFWLKDSSSDQEEMLVAFPYQGAAEADSPTRPIEQECPDRAYRSYYIFRFADFGLARLYHDPSDPHADFETLTRMKMALYTLLQQAVQG